MIRKPVADELSDLDIILQNFSTLDAATCLIDFTRSALVRALVCLSAKLDKGKANGKVFAVRSDDPVRIQNG